MLAIRLRRAGSKKRPFFPAFKLGRNSGAPFSGGGSSAASSAVIESVTARSAVRATSGASTKRRSPPGISMTIPSKMCSR